MRVLVTGATGFVGRAVVQRLLSRGVVVRGLARSVAPGLTAPDQASGPAATELFEARPATIGDPNAILDAAQGCEVVVHAAAIPSPRASEKALAWINVAGTENALNAAQRAGCPRFVFVSCADVTLANRDRVNWDEKRDLTTAPLDAHARSKRLAEELALSRAGSGFEVIALRPAWLWGPGDTCALPDLCAEGLATGLQTIGKGDNLIATTYIDTLVDAVIGAIEAPTLVAQPYYITDHEFIEAQEFLEGLTQAAGLKPLRSGPPYPLAYAKSWWEHRRRGPGLWPTDVIHRGRPTHFDVQRAMRDLSWKPHIDLDAGMAALGSWIRHRGGADQLAARRRVPTTDRDVSTEIELAECSARGLDGQL